MLFHTQPLCPSLPPPPNVLQIPPVTTAPLPPTSSGRGYIATSVNYILPPAVYLRGCWGQCDPARNDRYTSCSTSSPIVITHVQGYANSWRGLHTAKIALQGTAIWGRAKRWRWRGHSIDLAGGSSAPCNEARCPDETQIGKRPSEYMRRGRLVNAHCS